jgi:ketosteroid isomerase-like protein
MEISMNNIAIIETYYKAMGEKNIASMEKYLHPDVQFISPLSKTKGKEAVLEATKGFANFFKTLTIRSSFGSADQAMIVYDVDCPEPFGIIRTASLMTFKEGIIVQIELFFDARPFEKK